MTVAVADEKRKIMTLADAIAVSVNVSLRECITGAEIVEILQSSVLTERRIPHIGIMFSEVHPSTLSRFFSRYNITIEEAQKLYYILPVFYKNLRMESFLHGNMGKTT